VLTAALGAVALAAPASPAWRPDVAAAASWAARRPGEVSFAVQAGPRRYGSHTGRKVRAASLMKTIFLAAYLRRGDVRRRPLSAEEKSLLSPMIRRSDDVAATTVRARLGDARLRRFARAAGMRDLVLHPIWGASQTSARDQARLFARLPRLLPSRHRAYALRLLRTIVPAQRWGIGAVRLPAGWRAYFKGGWGRGTGAVSHQAALLEREGRRIAIAVTTTASPSHTVSTATLRGVFARLLRDLGRQEQMSMNNSARPGITSVCPRIGRSTSMSKPSQFSLLCTNSSFGGKSRS